MEKEKIQEKVRETIKIYLENATESEKIIRGIDLENLTISGESHLRNDFSFDSLDITEVTMELEKQFAVKTRRDAKYPITVGDMENLFIEVLITKN